MGKLSSSADLSVGLPHFASDSLGYVNIDNSFGLGHQIPCNREEMVDESTSSMEGTLDITLHHAHEIQNICIYGKQDVYAKFSFTHSQDAAFSTQPVKAGGKNPIFNQSLQIPVSKCNDVLKCEIWMMSCSHDYLEDQLLGFVLVPLSNLVGKRKITQDYLLTSTELFHTPAGTVCLSLSFTCLDQQPEHIDGKMYPEGYLTSPEVMLVGDQNHALQPMDYNKIEFPDLQTVSENHHMVSAYLKLASNGLRLDSGLNDKAYCNESGDFSETMDTMHCSSSSILQLGSFDAAEDDSEMTLDTSVDNYMEASEHSRDCHVFNESSPSHATISTEVPSSYSSERSVPILSEDQNSNVRHNNATSGLSTQATPLRGSVHSCFPADCLSSSSPVMNQNNEMEKVSAKGDDNNNVIPFVTPLVNITLEPPEPVVQQQIIDMYIQSMQQFTESLAKMKLPMDLDSHPLEPINAKTDLKGTQGEKKHGHRVFYGSRAFF